MRKRQGSTCVHSVAPQQMQRRTLLRGVCSGLGLSIGLPVLDIMLNNNGTALAQGGALPVRFGTFVWGGGVTHSLWNKGSGSLADFGGDLASYTTLIRRVSHKSAQPGHIPARGLALSSSHDTEYVEAKVGAGYRGQNMPEPSIDAIVSEAWKGKAKLDGLYIGIARKGPYASNSSWQRGGAIYNRHEPSPTLVFNRVFGAAAITNPGLPAAPMVQSTAKFEKSMLDAVIADAKALNLKLGAKDRVRMDAHLQGLRDLERRLQEREMMAADQMQAGGNTASSPSSSVGGGCTMAAPPPAKDFGDGTSKEEKEAKSKLMSDVLIMALKCDITRVFSYEWSANQSNAVYWEVGSALEQHEWSHQDAQGENYGKTITFIMKNLAYLANGLKNTPEGGGNLLDRTLIFGTSEHGNAGNHGYTDVPLLFVGKAAGKFRAGITHTGTGVEAAPSVMLSAVRAVGINLPTLGQAATNRQTSTPMKELLI